MKSIKKAIAGVICACMLFSASTITSSAKEVTQENTMESTVNDVTVAADSQSVNYVVIENDYVSTPATQYVVASIGNEGIGITAASLTYKNETTGKTYVRNSDKVQDFLVLFNLSFNDSSLAGQYKLVKIDYTTSDRTYSVDFNSIGLDTVFGVNTDVNAAPTGWLVDDETYSEDVGGVIVNDLGASEGVTSSDIAAAVEETGFTREDVVKSNTSSDGLVTASPDTFIVVLDPGHGAEDAGATRTYNNVTYYERDINLKIAQACKKELEKHGVIVYMTRTDNNTKPGLSERAQIAADYGADLFISIHNNSASNGSASGSEVWVPNSSSYNYYAHTTGESLGNEIIDNLASLGLTKRGVYTRNATDGDTYPTGDTSDYYTVINESRRRGIPGIIVEHAYISNQSDAENFLSSDDKLNAIGAADATGILAYLSAAPEKNPAVFAGVDYSAVYDFEYFYNENPDIQSKYGSNKTLMLKYFVETGMSEGLQASEEFNVTYYKNRYADLREQFGDDLKKYYMHYINKGKSEGRDAKTPYGTSGRKSDGGEKDDPKKEDKGLTVLNGVDYSAVYNYYYYIDKYPDLKAAFKDDQTATLTHFVNNGMKEGRQASEDFNVKYYRNRYPDLRSVFGKNYTLYYMHYMNNGINESRDAKTPCELQGGITVLNGVDYSAVYDFNYYIKQNPDVFNAFGYDEEKVLQHFVNNGMNEGRTAKAEFVLRYYKGAYPDLRSAFGNNNKAYYMHYINNGKKESRTANEDKGVVNPTTEYKGVDYSLVYDYNYYVDKNPDVKAVYGGDDEAVLKHFVVNGMREGRQAKDTFNVSYYKTNYGDLASVYGNNLINYYMHYVNRGYKENRVADRLLTQSTGYTPIMGDTNTNLNQMVAYYNANATYPEFYANSDAPTIEAFCQIYIEECKAEGVRADIAFCQAMKETGFLRYGGQVSIEQYNFAGLGATDDGAAGASFDSVRTGIRAQVQHLKAYASNEALKNACVDPRFSLVTRGAAIYVEWLGVNENPNGKGWATAEKYGYSLLNDYVAKLKKY
ncbi:MAG: N-acetylmuramoyl-L-alanine amidase [Lachnospiraceae bacterium]|nr:N-acetylmuramoyl-L-alanine amidase [Lachnospiraceae bacterium]